MSFVQVTAHPDNAALGLGELLPRPATLTPALLLQQPLLWLDTRWQENCVYFIRHVSDVCTLHVSRGCGWEEDGDDTEESVSNVGEAVLVADLVTR